MAGLLFVSQAMLEVWSGQGKIEFAGNVVTLREGAGSGRSYTLEPAVRFLEAVGGAGDPHGLVTKVKTEAQLRALGAERMGDSVLLGDIGYEVQPGYLMAASAPAGSEAAHRTDAGALARFLLENLA
jgi:hypothetical protein